MVTNCSITVLAICYLYNVNFEIQIYSYNVMYTFMSLNDIYDRQTKQTNKQTNLRHVIIGNCDPEMLRICFLNEILISFLAP